MSIVIDLQQEALSKEDNLLHLLRKAYLVARKLKLKEFEIWANHEMNGYAINDEVPRYRVYHGEIRAYNPYHGWIPVVFDKSSGLTKHEAREPISSLIDVYNQSEGRSARVLFPDDLNTLLSKSAPFHTKYCLEISTNMLFSTFESIRNTILDWAITLEENNILGEGLKFTRDEIEIAAEKSSSITNYISNFFGDVNNSQLQQGTNDSNQDQEV